LHNSIVNFGLASILWSFSFELGLQLITCWIVFISLLIGVHKEAKWESLWENWDKKLMLTYTRSYCSKIS
jgi:hypothetical protein